MTTKFEDIIKSLKELHKIPEHDETFEINCKCDEGILKCKGHAWQW